MKPRTLVRGYLAASALGLKGTKQLDEKGFTFWEDIFDPLPHGADLAEIAVRAMRLECDEIYVLPTPEEIIIRFFRQHEWFKSFRMASSRLKQMIEQLKASAHLQSAGRKHAQEGTLKIRHENEEIDFFVRVVRTSVGERVYLRLL